MELQPRADSCRRSVTRAGAAETPLDQFKRTTLRAIITLALLSTVVAWGVLDARGALSPAFAWVERTATLALALLCGAAWSPRVPQRALALACLVSTVGICTACMALPMYWPQYGGDLRLAPLYLWIPVVYVLAFTLTDHRTGLRISLGIMLLFIAVSLPWMMGHTGTRDSRNLTLQLHFVSAILIAALYFFSSFQYRLGSAQRTVDELAQISNTDALTGVPNRRRMAALVAAELADARGKPPRFALLLFDLDHFKAVNDAYGHAAGDRVLVALAQRATRVFRSTDTLGRWGGDEFLVVVRNVDGAALDALAEALRAAIADRPLVGHLRTTISCGVALAAAGDTLDSLLQRADVALYEAKRAGRDRIRQAPPVAA